jgi:hypothetical protein
VTDVDEHSAVSLSSTEHMSEADPCPACPWRKSNQDRNDHPDGWYTRGNLARLWRGIRNGEPQSCHPTDPCNPVSAEAEAAGYRKAPAGSQVLECRGAVILAQRELHLLSEDYGGDFRAYRRERPHGLTRDGLRSLLARLMFGGVPLVGGVRMARPNLNAKGVQYLDKLPWLNVEEEVRGAGDPS